MIQQFTVSRDDSIYEAFPDVALTASGRLVCVFAECTHHGDREYTRIVVCDSTDRGRTWSAKRALTEPLHKSTDHAHWNCARITALSDGRLAVVVDRISGRNEGADQAGRQENVLFFSDDDGARWDGPHPAPVEGIVPDQLVELKCGEHAGRWLITAHTVTGSRVNPTWRQRVWYSDDQGTTWSEPIVIAAEPLLRLCEGSIVELPAGELVCFMRENSGQGYDAHKSISTDGGATWSTPVAFPIPACHRPVAGVLGSGHVLIAHRFMQGGAGWVGWWTQNLFAAWADVGSCLAPRRCDAHARIMPVAYDRSPASDTGYCGWAQLDDGEIYLVNYVLDDAPRAQIRGYAFAETDIVLDPQAELGWRPADAKGRT